LETTSTAPPEPGPAISDRFDSLLAGYRQRLEESLGAWIAARRSAAAASLPESVELVDGIAELVASGGKRLRPAMVWFSHAACGGGREQAVEEVAMATELLHTYLLIHDDIMDHAAVRRGRPAAHARYAGLAQRRGWGGDGDDFGRSAAILLGDLAHTWAVELFAAGRRLVPDAATRAALDRTWSEMGAEVIGGQYLELGVALRGAADEDDLLRVLRLKSGRYTAERPLQLGALLAGAAEPVRDALAIYGRAVGEAFQLQDDVLGVFGDAGTVGKPVGADLAEGKFTFLVFHALELAAPADAELLRSALGRTDLSPAALEAAREVIRTSGALARVTAMIDERLATARAALGSVELEPDGAELLGGLVDRLRERRR
jgi:geranylgeranyl diphosphate synthase type I